MLDKNRSDLFALLALQAFDIQISAKPLTSPGDKPLAVEAGRMPFAAGEAIEASHNRIFSLFLLIGRPHLVLDVRLQRSGVASLDLFQRQVHTEPVVSSV